MTTRTDMVNAGKEAVRLGVQYIYGAKPSKGAFRTYSEAEINALRAAYGAGCVWPSDSNKAGRLCCDCSGLITYATGQVLGSWQLNNMAIESVPISKLDSNWKHYVGWVLWMDGHVGIVSDTPGYYYAMDGSARNASHLPLYCNQWVKALRIPYVDYEQEEEMTDAEMRKLVDMIKQELPAATWLQNINGVKAVDRLQGIDEKTNLDRLSKSVSNAVWASQLNANGGTSKNKFKASEYLTNTDHRCDLMQTELANNTKMLKSVQSLVESIKNLLPKK